LRKKAVQDLRNLESLVVARKIRAIAPVLVRAEEEHLNAGLPSFLVRSEQVRFVNRLGIDALIELHMRERANAVAQPRGLLKVQRFGSAFHLFRQLGAHLIALAQQELARLFDEMRIILVADLVHAWA